MTNKEDVDGRDMYYEAIDAIDSNLVKKTNDGMMYITDMKNGRSDGKMQHLVSQCGHTLTDHTSLLSLPLPLSL